MQHASPSTRYEAGRVKPSQRYSQVEVRRPQVPRVVIRHEDSISLFKWFKRSLQRSDFRHRRLQSGSNYFSQTTFNKVTWLCSFQLFGFCRVTLGSNSDPVWTVLVLLIFLSFFFLNHLFFNAMRATERSAECKVWGESAAHLRIGTPTLPQTLRFAPGAQSCFLHQIFNLTFWGAAILLVSFFFFFLVQFIFKLRGLVLVLEIKAKHSLALLLERWHSTRMHKCF